MQKRSIKWNFISVEPGFFSVKNELLKIVFPSLMSCPDKKLSRS